MTQAEEILIGNTLIYAISKVYPAIMERSESKNEKQEGKELLNSLN